MSLSFSTLFYLTNKHGKTPVFLLQPHQDILMVAADYFSCFVVLAPLQNKSCNAVAHALVTHLLRPYTTPTVLLSDNGTEFKNKILQNICKQYNITQTFVSVQYPASNSIVERTNKKILDVLRHVVSQLHDSWQDWLPHVTASINGSINASTGKNTTLHHLWIRETFAV
ncbi:Retrovirus-related Pol polyprotein [Portunus trituberculatus]|uniref:Retrovirus-related Pol polyprotein n=1 Tax=Portunus trituberculatus TaxID=210409 RepID=A0A5B7DWK1_PORTR|nr:Retrovirus-related Pol polyprotein [Portunus trituberculatus]